MCKAPDLRHQHSGPSVSSGGLGVHLRVEAGEPWLECCMQRDLIPHRCPSQKPLWSSEPWQRTQWQPSRASILRHQCRGGDTKVSSKVTGMLDKKPHSLGLRLGLLLPSTEILAVPPLSPPCPLSLMGETQPLITARAPSTGFIIVNNNSGQQQTLTVSQEVYSALSKGYRSK